MKVRYCTLRFVVALGVAAVATTVATTAITDDQHEVELHAPWRRGHGRSEKAKTRWLVGSFGACALTQQQQINPRNVTSLTTGATFPGTTLHTCANAESLVRAFELSNGTLRGLLNLGFSYSMGPDGQLHNAGGYFIYNRSCHAAGGGVSLMSCGGYSGLVPGWKAQVLKDVATIGPALRNGSVVGVYLGDEILETARIPFADYVSLATELKAAMSEFGGGHVYGNEGGWYNLGHYDNAHCPPAAQGGCNQSQCYSRPCTGFTWYDPVQLPPAIDLFSFDHYVPFSCSNAESCSGVKPSACATMRSPGMDHWNLSFVGACSQDPTAESHQVREIYQKLLYPKMHSHQRLLVVPGAYICMHLQSALCIMPSLRSSLHDDKLYTRTDLLTPSVHVCRPLFAGLFADADGNRSGSLSMQDDFMVAKLHAYRQWMEEDDRIAGLWGWHWGDEPLQTTKAQGFTFGASRLPRTVAFLQELARATT